MNGYAGRLLWIDLTRKKVVKHTLSKELIKNYIGGRGFNVKILWDKLKPRCAALSPDNLLIVSSGALCSTFAPSCAKLTISSKSPATDLYFKTVVGGHFASEMKFAGFDTFVVSGAAKRPVYISILDEEVEIKDATRLWGADVYSTDRLIKQDIREKDASVISIGPAGENLVYFASIASDIYRRAARGGLGSVMGYKKLKAVSVRGSGAITVANPEEFKDVALEARKRIRDDEYSWRRKYLFGTNRGMLQANKVGSNPTRNFQTGSIEDAYKTGGEYIREKYLVRETGCFGCVMNCGRYWEIPSGPYMGTFTEGAEWGGINPLGARLGIVDVEFILKAYQLCNKLGLDAESVGGVVSFAMELFGKGIINKKDTGGVALDWGNQEATLQLVKKIAYREGFGNILANGTKKAAQKIGKGSEKYAVHIKGLEISAVELRVSKAYALAFAVNPRGGDHLHTNIMCQFGGSPEMIRMANRLSETDVGANPVASEGKAKMVKAHEEMVIIADCLGMCFFNMCSSYSMFDPRVLSKMYSAASGFEISPEQSLLTAERILNLERRLNLREGLKREQDTLPARMFDDPIANGPTKGYKMSHEEFENMLKEYYTLHGWDVETGIPSDKTLRKLGLEDGISSI